MSWLRCRSITRVRSRNRNGCKSVVIKPDYVIMWGWGVMNQVAVQEAANIRFPMENFIGVWWSGSEFDVLPAGEAANGYKALTFPQRLGTDFPVYGDLRTHVVDAGKAAGAGDQVGTVLYNRGLYAADAGRRGHQESAGNLGQC